MAWFGQSGDGVLYINEVTRRRAGYSTEMDDRSRTYRPGAYATSLKGFIPPKLQKLDLLTDAVTNLVNTNM